MTRNITLAVDDAVLDRYRAVAAQHGTSVNAMIREHMARTVGAKSEEQRAAVERMRARALLGPRAAEPAPIERGWRDHAG